MPIFSFSRRHWTLSARLSLGVLLSVAILFVAALFIMFRLSHNAIEKESLAKAEKTLQGTTTRINNMLYGVEVATTNMCWNVEHHLDNPDLMVAYTREVVKTNPAIVSCTAAFEPGYYPVEGGLFMVQSYREGGQQGAIVTSRNPMEIEAHVMSNLPYPAHNWFFIPKQANTVCWVRPHAATDTILSSVVTCSMPIHDPQGNIVGVFASDISVDWLSTTVLNTKPYPNSYCCMVGVQGTYIIHPDSTRLYHTFVADVIKDEEDERVPELVESMLKGESGCRAVHIFDKDSYVLYESLNAGHWSACIVCPESDIFSANERLTRHMITITCLGLLAILVFCMVFITRQMKPLSQLARSAARIAKGEYELAIPLTPRKDEIGTLQNAVQAMQKSLYRHVTNIRQMSTLLKERNESLVEAYDQVRKANQQSTTFVHKIADKMIPPVKVIESSVNRLQQSYTHMKQKDITPLAEMVLAQIKTITDLLDKMAPTTQKKAV